MKRRLLLILPLLIVMSLFVFFQQGLKQDPHLLPSTRLKQPAPPFSLSILNQNNHVTEKIFFQHQSLLIVWASWCETCTEEQTFLFQLKKKYPGLQLIGLNYKDDPQAANTWLKKYGNPYQLIVQDRQGSTAIDYGVYGTPEIFLIGPQGTILAKHIGVLDQTTFAKDFLPLIT